MFQLNILDIQTLEISLWELNIQKIDFDDSLEITINNKSAHISNDVARNLLIKQK